MSGTLPEGTVFAGRYRLVRCIATGGMGAVYEAVHLDTARRRALKVMHPHLFQNDEMRERFKREARIAAEVESEYIVDVSDAGVDEATGMPFLVMELLRGEELGDRLKRQGRFPPGEVVTYLQQVAWALDRTHAASIVHRDLKPANLFLTQREDGTPRIKILDFGVAKLVAEGATAAGATRSLGTPLYMAPEQFRAGARLTGAADIHALGMMAYTLLVGEAYWSHEAKISGDVIAFALAAMRGPEEPPVRRAASRGVALPPGFDGWFARATAMDPLRRYPTASEAVQALRNALIDAPDPAATAPAMPVIAAGTAAPTIAMGITPAPAITGWSPPPLPEATSAIAVAAAPAPPPPAISAPVAATGGVDQGVTPASVAGLGSSAAGPAMGSGSLSGTALLEQAATSTSAALTPAPVERRRGPALAVGTVLGIASLGLGAWGALRAVDGGAPAPATVSETRAPPPVSAAPPAPAPPATLDTASRAPAPSVEPASPAPSAQPASPTASAALPPSTAVTRVLPPGKGQGAKAPGKPAPTAVPFLGRD